MQGMLTGLTLDSITNNAYTFGITSGVWHTSLVKTASSIFVDSQNPLRIPTGITVPVAMVTHRIFSELGDFFYRNKDSFDEFLTQAAVPALYAGVTIDHLRSSGLQSFQWLAIKLLSISFVAPLVQTGVEKLKLSEKIVKFTKTPEFRAVDCLAKFFLAGYISFKLHGSLVSLYGRMNPANPSDMKPFETFCDTVGIGTGAGFVIYDLYTFFNKITKQPPKQSSKITPHPLLLASPSTHTNAQQKVPLPAGQQVNAPKHNPSTLLQQPTTSSSKTQRPIASSLFSILDPIIGN